MPLFALLLIVGFLVAGPSPAGLPILIDWVPLNGRILLWLVPKLLIVVLTGWRARRAMVTLTRNPYRTMAHFARWRSSLRGLLLFSFGIDLALGWWAMVQTLTGDAVLLDELLTLAPTLAAVIAGWWLEYPIDRRFREAVLIRRLDTGQPVAPIWSRGQFIAHQARHQLALGLVPGILFLAWWDAARLLWPDGLTHWPQSLVPLLDNSVDPHTAVTLMGAALIAIATPPLLCWVWDTQPLPEGPLRQRLEGLCRQKRVRVRKLLYWHTHGCMANAAVMGPIRPVRYVLLSDALLESLSEPQITAVMAHELAHVRRHHIPWMMLAMLASGGWLAWVSDGVVQNLPQWSALTPWWEISPPWLADLSVMLVAIAVWITLFGLVSRRFERQADAFAVAHFSASHDTTRGDGMRGDSMRSDGTHDGTRHDVAADAHGQPDMQDAAAAAAVAEDPVITPAAVTMMADALLTVAALNGMSTQRRDFRHGSIASRITALQRLVGYRLDQLPIDRTVRRVKLMTMVALLLAALLMAFGAA